VPGGFGTGRVFCAFATTRTRGSVGLRSLTRT